jgi:hypothetical protein
LTIAVRCAPSTATTPSTLAWRCVRMWI